MNNKKELIRAVKFLFFSVSAGVIQAGSCALMNEVFQWNYWVCYLTALVLSVLWNFTLNRKFTFYSANNIPIAMLKVAAFYLVFTPLSTWGGQVLNDLGWNEYIVLAISMITNFVTEFLYDRFVVFGASVDTAMKEKNGAAQ